MAALFYTASSAICTPNSFPKRSAWAGSPSRRGPTPAVFEEAGYSSFRRAAETPLNLIIEARP